MAGLFDMNDCRAWLQQNGYTVGERGVIAQKYQAAYFAAGCPKPERTAPPSPPRVLGTVRAPQEPQNAEPVRQEREEADEPAEPRRATRKVILPHHYDPRPTLFSGSACAVQIHAQIEPTRAFWTVAEMEELARVHGDAPLRPGFIVPPTNGGTPVSDPSERLSA